MLSVLVRCRLHCLIGLMLLSACVSSWSQESVSSYPNRPIKMVVPYPPTGLTDVLGRLIAERLGAALKQPVLIENKPGAGTLLGAEQVARSAPDGYTLMAASVGQMSLNPHSFTNLPYDPQTTFAPVTGLVATNYFWAVHPDVPANTVREYVDWAKANPGRANFGSTGIGTPSHLAGVMLAQASGAPLVNVPYKGVGPAITDLLGGRISAAFVTLVLVKDAVRKIGRAHV